MLYSNKSLEILVLALKRDVGSNKIDAQTDFMIFACKNYIWFPSDLHPLFKSR